MSIYLLVFLENYNCTTILNHCLQLFVHVYSVPVSGMCSFPACDGQTSLVFLEKGVTIQMTGQMGKLGNIQIKYKSAKHVGRDLGFVHAGSQGGPFISFCHGSRSDNIT